MSDSLPDDQDSGNELHLLILARENDELAPEDHARLERMILEDAGAREFYARYLLQTANLRAWAEATTVAEEDSHTVPAQNALRETATAVPKSPLLGFLNRLPAAIQPAQHPVHFLLVAASLTAVLWGAIFSFVSFKNAPQQTDLATQPTNTVATLSKLQQVLWQPDRRTYRAGYRLNPEDVLEFKSGLLELTFDGGARVAIEGPAAIRILSSHRMELGAGKLLARAAAQAGGFTVDVSQLEVVDIGTEFGIQTQGFRTELQVFDGSVQVSPKDRGKKSQRIIKAGEAAVFTYSPSLGLQTQEKKMNRAIYMALATVLALPNTAQVQAVPIAVPNFSFQNPSLADNTTSPGGDGNTTAVPGWIINIPVPGTGTTAGAGIQNPVNAYYAGTTGASAALPVPADGSQYAYLSLAGTGPQTSRLTSASSLATIQNNATYAMTVAVGRRLDFAPENIEIALLANGTPIPGTTMNLVGSSLTAGAFVDATSTFTTLLSGDPLAGQALTVRFTHTKGAIGDIRTVNFDNVRLTLTELPVPPAPEPSTGIIVPGALVLFGLKRRMKRKSAA